MIWPFRRRRLLFRYHNGERRIAADPLVLYRRLIKEGDQLVVLATAFDQQKDPEADEFIRRLCEIFGLSRWDPATGRGLTDAEIIRVFQDFNVFLQEIRENFFPGSTSPPRSAGGSSPAPESPSQTPVGGSP